MPNEPEQSAEKWNVIFYETENGKTPVFDFLESLPTPLKAKAYAELELLQDFGNALGMPYSRPMSDGLFELRIAQSSNQARIFYFFRVGNNIILTNGFIKKTQKTPKSELEKARKYKLDFEQREKTK